jgi:hypothetical protein
VLNFPSLIGPGVKHVRQQHKPGIQLRCSEMDCRQNSSAETSQKTAICEIKEKTGQ